MFKPALEVLEDRTTPSFVVAAPELISAATGSPNFPLFPPEINSAATGSPGLLSGNVGFGNSGNNNIGFGNSGNNNIGLFNSGSGNIGFGNSGSGNFGIGNSGNHDIGIGNNGSFNTGQPPASYVGLLTTAVAWDGLASELQSAANSYSSTVSSLSGGAWSGSASVAMSNDALLPVLVATNFLGQNTPAIAATEAEYAEMWAQDTAVMADQAGTALASPGTGVVPAAADEVSAAIAELFGAHAGAYQALSSQAAAFHEQFIQGLNAASGQYASTESANLGATG